MASAPKRSNANLQPPEVENGDLDLEIDSSTKSEVAIAAARAIETEIETLRRHYKKLKADCGVLKAEAKEKKQQLAHQRKINRRTKAAIEAMKNEIKAREDNIEKEKKLTQEFIEKKQEIQKQLAARRIILEKKNDELRAMCDDMSAKCQENEKGYLSLPDVAEFKKLHDENKRLETNVELLRVEIKEKKTAIAMLEEEIAQSEPADQAWNKVCIQLANDYVHTKRMQAEIDQLTSKMEQDKQKSLLKAKNNNSSAQRTATTPVQARPPPKTPYTMPHPRPAAIVNRNALTPAAVSAPMRSAASPMVLAPVVAQTPPVRSAPTPIPHSPRESPMNYRNNERQNAMNVSHFKAPYTVPNARSAMTPRNVLTPAPPVQMRPAPSPTARFPVQSLSFRNSTNSSSSNDSSNDSGNGNPFNLFGFDGSDDASQNDNDVLDNNMNFNFGDDGNDDDGDSESGGCRMLF